MKTKIPWTFSRIISLLLGIFFLFTTIYFGIGLIAVGNSLIKSQSNNGEDWSSVFGFIFQATGQEIAIVSALLALLFMGLYFSTTRRLKKQSY